MAAPSTASRPAAPARAVPGALDHPDAFVRRHVGPGEAEQTAMLEALGLPSLAALVERTVPKGIRLSRPLGLDGPRGEHEALVELRAIASQNRVFRSYLGQGYHDTLTPPVIQRNILENPGWYTQYTPYQAEISQGRLEAMLNFQTMVCDLAGMQIANASMLDEATAAAEAMHLCFAVSENPKAKTFVVASDCHPQTIEVVRTRAKPLGIRVVVADPADLPVPAGTAGVLVQYPATDGTIRDHRALAQKAHAAGARVVAATDPLALVLLTPPGDWGADVVVGSTQRFGVPMGYGGPHAGFLATRDEYKRQMPGRLVGVSKDTAGRHGLRLALGTREQHIRRERATSNICTAQVLLAVVASMYAVYHGPEGLRAIASRVRTLTEALRRGLVRLGLAVAKGPVFDTLRVETGVDGRRAALRAAAKAGINLRTLSPTAIGIALDEATTAADVADLLACFHGGAAPSFSVDDLLAEGEVPPLPAPFARTSEILTHPVFHAYRSETELLRYMHRLQAKDLSLTTSMIPLGSCTMKLNATVEMFPVTWAEFGRLHPFAPVAQARGYAKVFADLERWLAEITGFAAVSLQPNAGSQGEYAGLLVIRAWHRSRGHGDRDVCLIPSSAHGTNPASAVMAGMRVVVVGCDAKGNVDVADLRAKAAEHAERLAALMITYPSTHGVFEESIREICDVVHAAGGQVYMDGANMNAQVGLCRPGDFGPDVCHLNLHKTFCLAEGTPVTLADGTTRAIEDLRVGEEVLAWSPDDRDLRARELVGAWRTGRKPCVQVTLEDERTIVCTPDHRVLTTSGWVEAGRLKIGMHRIVASSASTLHRAARVEEEALEAVGVRAGLRPTYAVRQDASMEPTVHLGVVAVRLVGERDVYDLTVEGLHSFLANGVVVHNCIPHGGGGPGMGPIGVAEHLAPFLPGHPVVKTGGDKRIGPVSAAPWGSPSILVIPWVYIRCMGGSGLTTATEVAILNANYMAKRLEGHYPVLYRGVHGTVAHEFILDLRKLKEESGVEAIDVAKRLMDYGFHAPTVSFPVAGTLMVEPTESESKAELDRFCDALIAIRAEIQAVIDGELPRDDNPLKGAPHTAEAVTATEWKHAYPRETAAYPAPWTHAHKFWPAVARIDDVYGDRNLMCLCPPPDAYSA